MFSGIIQTVVPVREIYNTTNYKIYTVVFPENLLKNLKIGCSVSNNGCCLTVISIKRNLVSFNLIYETLKLTNMNMLQIGDLINIERSLNYHSEIGGHLMTGHIDCTGEIKKIINFHTNIIVWFKIKNKNFNKYIIKHGSIGIEGVSLTINKIINNYIRISLTPYTATTTNLGFKKVGNIVNIETDLTIKAIINNTEKTISTIIKTKMNLKKIFLYNSNIVKQI